MEVGWNELEAFVFFSHEFLQDCWALVVEVVHFLALARVQRVGCGFSCNFLGSPGHCNVHGFGMYCVGVVVVGNHDVFETAAGCDGESAGLIRVKFS